MKLAQLYKLYSKSYLVDTDTRRIRNNSLFFALKGDNFNGNKYANEAIKKGASYSIVDEKEYVTSENIILVDNVLETLQKLANYHRQQLNIPIIALTGSNGKTTTKELICAVLNKKLKATATVGNLNNHIGVPLTLLSMTVETEIGIVEMGANHHKEIAFLSLIAQPDFGYITNFGKAHLEGFGSVEGVIKAKSELYDFLKSNNKTAFINPKDKVQKDKTEEIKRVFFDESLIFLEVTPFVKLSFNNTEILSNLIGKYNYNNIAAAITIGTYFNVSEEKIKEAIEGYLPSNNRSQIIENGTNKIILDAYNANPTSMKAALDSFNSISANNKMVVLGDMFELGEVSLIEHQKITDLTASFNFEKTFFVGENFYKAKTKNKKFKTFADLKEHLQKNKFKNYTLLIKGSRGMALERILDLI